MFFQDTSAPAAAGGTTNAEAMKQMGFDHLIHNFDPLGWIVFITLVVMSFSSWYFIIANAIRNAMVRSRADKVIQGFWSTTSTQDAIRELEAQPKGEPFSKIALDAASAVAHHQQASQGGGRLAESLSRSEFIDRALRQAVARESLRLEGGLTLLATVGSSAPFIGLLGTVWGIYHALIKISASGNASMEAVAGPVGEALIMTAFGLFTAIPAVLAYNAFNRANRVTYAQFDEFAHDLHDFFATGARVESK
ncbi:MotA/TolQ/ExbB proton channel family protein [Fulvimonas soli]|jgi:biopolymer transport protein ExbB|uniref:Biopolymer transport protein ExbB n=1 Tax=Fulvimonas soli TaxID=155197 RepID=A0A316IHL4_9GAMM|nr:MotA/TolQ/ExbB proton channel family protein [Fulvimonas soli]PWK92543.1 outer membrane transport energization protein ExbB [Fulvimonas soli]TNY27753.1 biopolymer transporter ExbB [Fulvimonas soli]